MQVHLGTGSSRVERPWYAWIAAVLAILTSVGAIPVGWTFLVDPSGRSMGLPLEWIAGSVFGNYAVPGLYLLVMNGFGMLVLAALIVARHWLAPWLTAVLGVGLIIWIAVQLVLMPQTMWLQWFFLGTGVGMGFIALFWLRRTGQLRLWQ